MDLLSLFRRASQRMPTPINPPGPERLRLPQPVGQPGPIHELLDDLGLPWREPRASVELLYGIREDPLYQRKVVFFEDAERPNGFIQSWQADVFERYAPEMPVVRFSGIAWFGPDADDNLRRVAEPFAQRLGHAPIGQQYNTLVCGWRSGAASLGLQAWPPAWQSRDLKNDAQAREPRLVTACRVTLLTGFRLPLSALEEEWLAGFRPLAATGPMLRSASVDIVEIPPNDTELEYVRDPGPWLSVVRNRVGCSTRAEALILCTHQLFVVAASDILGFEVIRMLPAKGGGGSSLLVRCRTPCPDVPCKTLHVAQDSDPDGVTSLGRHLADVFNKSCEVGPYFDDV